VSDWKNRRIFFFAEMAVSPILAGSAYLVPVAAHWGALRYIPLALWLGVLAQCLFTFRWRGLWFLLGPPVATLAIVAFLVVAPAVPKQAAPSLLDLPKESAAPKDSSAIRPPSGP
jgi:hypothetical protein